MAEQSPPFSATPLERPSRSLVPTSSHRRSASVACTRVLWNLISSAKAVRLHHEQAQKLCRVVSEKPTSLRLPVLAADVETTARGLTSSAASSPTTSTTASSTAVAAHHTAQLEDAGSILCVNVTVPQNVPLPLDEEPDIADMDTTSTRKRSRPSESGSDDEGGSRKMHAVAPERATVACLTPTSNDAVAHEDAVTHATDEISQSEFQTVLSKSKKRRQRASTSQGPAAHTGPRPATESTAMLAHVAPGTSNAPTATQTAPAGVRATEHTMPASASSSLDSGTILFRPANASASFHRTSRLAIAQALSALPGVKEVRVNTKKNIVAADASTPEWMNRLLATSELAGIPVTARLPADRSQSSGVVQGVDGDYTDEALLAAVSSDVPVIAARRQGTSLVLRFASPVPPTRVRLFRMVFEPPAAAPTLGTPASEPHPAMALNAATDQQYHLLNQDGTADDQMNQLQGDHDTKTALAIQEERASTDSAEPPPQSSRRGEPKATAGIKDAPNRHHHFRRHSSWRKDGGGHYSLRQHGQRRGRLLEDGPTQATRLPYARRGATPENTSGISYALQQTTRKRSQNQNPPPLPLQDEKIILRPHGGLCLDCWTRPELANALWSAAGLSTEDRQNIIFRLRPQQNLAVISTPKSHVADALYKVWELRLGQRVYPITTYFAAPDNSCKGIVPRLVPGTPSSTRVDKLLTPGTQILQARMMGQTVVPLVTFEGFEVPRYVRFYGAELSCYPHHPRQLVCKICHRLGHWADHCPTPYVLICATCGTDNPAPSHPCTPHCRSCDGSHPTSDPNCPRRAR
ncbi:hypothetical protein MRX96_040062 [Rhipicephalus microplus]